MPQKWPAQKHLDLIACIERGLSCREAAAQIGVSAATAVRWTQAAGLTSAKGRRLGQRARAALREALLSGLRPAEAAAKFQVSRSTVARLAPCRDARRAPVRRALHEAVEAGLSRRQAAAALGLPVATAIRWARGVYPSSEAARLAKSARKPRPLRFRPDRDAKRAQLLEFIESGLSRRKAAAELGLPVATAIRWASGAARRQET